MAMILDDNIWVLGLDNIGQLSEQCWLTNTCHIFQADFRSTSFNELVCNAAVVFYRMNRRISDTERCLRGHTCLKSPFDTRDDIANIVQAAEYACNVNTLCVLHLVLQLTEIVRTREHTESVETAVEHVRFNTHFVERLCKRAYCIVGILAVEKIHLLKSTTIGFYTSKTPHLDDDRCNAFQLVLARLKFTVGLEHVTIDKAELNFTFCCHILQSIIWTRI